MVGHYDPANRDLGRARTSAILLDRDGVINRKLPEDSYVRNPDQFEFLPGVFDALSILQDMGYVLMVVTNQRGIGRGFMSEEDLSRVHAFMQQELSERGIFLDRIYHCPHDIHEACPCRKPAPGMILEALAHKGADRETSFMVGDSIKDIIAGRSAGVTAVRISADNTADGDLRFPSLLDFARYLYADQHGPVVTPEPAGVSLRE